MLTFLTDILYINVYYLVNINSIFISIFHLLYISFIFSFTYFLRVVSVQRLLRLSLKIKLSYCIVVNVNLNVISERCVYNSPIFVYSFCLIDLCFSFPRQAFEIKSLNIERS